MVKLIWSHLIFLNERNQLKQRDSVLKVREHVTFSNKAIKLQVSMFKMSSLNLLDKQMQ